jgi:hypothetical protein
MLSRTAGFGQKQSFAEQHTSNSSLCTKPADDPPAARYQSVQLCGPAVESGSAPGVTGAVADATDLEGDVCGHSAALLRCVRTCMSLALDVRALSRDRLRHDGDKRAAGDVQERVVRERPGRPRAGRLGDIACGAGNHFF